MLIQFAKWYNTKIHNHNLVEMASWNLLGKYCIALWQPIPLFQSAAAPTKSIRQKFPIHLAVKFQFGWAHYRRWSDKRCLIFIFAFRIAMTYCPIYVRAMWCTTRVYIADIFIRITIYSQIHGCEKSSIELKKHIQLFIQHIFEDTNRSRNWLGWYLICISLNKERISIKYKLHTPIELKKPSRH